MYNCVSGHQSSELNQEVEKNAVAENQDAAQESTHRMWLRRVRSLTFPGQSKHSMRQCNSSVGEPVRALTDTVRETSANLSSLHFACVARRAVGSH
jgi:hypothetical protein